MTNENDLFITFAGSVAKDQIIDSYDLIHKITVELVGQNKIFFSIDNTLPLIKGNPEYIDTVFKEFINSALSHYKGLKGKINIVHIKDPKFWIFGFFVKGDLESQCKDDKVVLVDKVSNFTLAISK